MDEPGTIRTHDAGRPVDRLPAQPLVMQFAALHAGLDYNDYVTDPRRLAEAQLAMADDFGIDCLMTCSDPARELIDIAGDDVGRVGGLRPGHRGVTRRAAGQGRASPACACPTRSHRAACASASRSIELMRAVAGPGRLDRGLGGGTARAGARRCAACRR